MRRRIQVTALLTIISLAALQPALAGDTHGGGGPRGGRVTQFGISDSLSAASNAPLWRQPASAGQSMGSLAIAGEDLDTPSAPLVQRSGARASNIPRLRFISFLMYLTLLDDFIYF